MALILVPFKIFVVVKAKTIVPKLWLPNPLKMLRSFPRGRPVKLTPVTNLNQY
jgi:hypothetical protein